MVLVEKNVRADSVLKCTWKGVLNGDKMRTGCVDMCRLDQTLEYFVTDLHNYWFARFKTNHFYIGIAQRCRCDFRLEIRIDENFLFYVFLVGAGGWDAHVVECFGQKSVRSGAKDGLERPSRDFDAMRELQCLFVYKTNLGMNEWP